MPAKDYYQVLGLTKTATEKDIKAAYRKLARKYHPDVNQNDKSAEATFKAINQAYQVLSDKEKRDKYDQFGPDFEKYGQAPPPGAGGFGGPGPGGFGGRRVNVEDLGDLFGNGGSGNLGDLLGGMFGGAARNVRGGRSGFGQPQYAEEPEAEPSSVDITVQEAFRGTQKSFELQLGRQTQRLTLTVPPGVSEGSVLRIKGEASRPQDLLFKIHVNDDEVYQLKGADIYTEVPITVTEAVLGAEIRFPTLKGTATMKIPAGTQAGKTFRMGGQGLPAFGTRAVGNLYVKARIVIPEPVTDEQRALFEQLAQLPHEDPRLQYGRK